MKSLKQIAKKWTVLGIVLSLLLGFGLVSCASDDDETKEPETETVTVTLVAEAGASGTSYTIEKGKTIADISGYTAPAKEGYTFSGWQDATGKSYTTSTKITSSVTLTATWTKDAVVTTNEDGTTTTTTETQNADGSTTTTAVTKDESGSTTKTVTETMNTDGSSVTETKTSDGTITTETVNADKSSSTTTKKTDESGTTTTTTVNKDSSGNTTGSTVVTESNSTDGTTTTTTVEKDATGATTQTTTVTETSDGKVTTTVTDANGKTTTTEIQKEYKAYIDAGIKALESETPDIDSAITNFNKAYTTEANDETRVYSALASLASISTSSAAASFFKNHLGIQNYPSTLNALFDESWLEETEYINYTAEVGFSAYSGFTEVTSPSSGGYYYRCSIAPAASYDSSSNTVPKYGIYTKATINGETVYATLDDIADYEKNTTGSTDYDSYYYTYTLDDSGEYYVYIYSGSSSSSDLSSHTAYTASGWTSAEYSYDVKTKFATLSVPEWLKSSSLNNTLGALLLANILDGNTNGLNSALDDFYSLIFDSTEYSDAISKIDAITSSVKIPANVIEDFGLTDIVGGASVKLGAPELKLIKTAFTALKATLEYFQSYNLNSDLSFLEFDWADADTLQEKFETYCNYDESIDPLKNGFLSQRSESKMSQSKSDFAEAVGDLISAYKDILSAPGDYPTALTDKLDEYKILKSGAEQLQDAIENGGKFYIPDAETEDELTSLSSWPTSGDKYVDLGALFDNDTFALKNILDVTSGNTPRIYSMREYIDRNTDENYYASIKTITYYSNGESVSLKLPDASLSSSATDDNGKTSIQLYLEACKDNFWSVEDYGYTLGFRIDYFSSIQKVLCGFDLTSYSAMFRDHSQTNSDGTKSVDGQAQYIPLGIIPGLYVYNFYHDGAITDDLKEIIENYYDDDEDDDEEENSAIAEASSSENTEN